MDKKPAIRLDKWLWHARFFKTRTLAAKMVSAGKVKVNAVRVTKPATAVGPGDGLTFVAGERVRVVRIAAIGTRRGPASEAQQLYLDLSTPVEKTARADTIRVGSRPTKKERRAIDAIRHAPP